MKQLSLLLALGLMSYPMYSSTSVMERVQDCHEYACQVAEQGASMGGDIEDIYEMAYGYCMENQQ